MNQLIWTSERPTVPGAYWMRDVVGAEPTIHDIWMECGRLKTRWPDGSESWIEDESGQFAGPIPEPVSEAQHSNTDTFRTLLEEIADPEKATAYHSAIEIDTYRGLSGEEWMERVLKALGRK
jgi:hypothetical protein